MSASFLVSAAPSLASLPIHPPHAAQPVRPPDSLFPLSCRRTTLGPPFPALRSWAGHRHPHRPPRTSHLFLRHTAIASVLSLREFYPYHLTCFLSVSLGPTWSFPLCHKSTLGLNRVFREKPLVKLKLSICVVFIKFLGLKKPSEWPYLKSRFSAMRHAAWWGWGEISEPEEGSRPSDWAASVTHILPLSSWCHFGGLTSLGVVLGQPRDPGISWLINVRFYPSA